MIPLTVVAVLILLADGQVPPAFVTQSPQRTLPQCQCIPDASGQGCLQYDSRLQAATLEEAMASFPDLSIERNETNPDDPLELQAACNTQECMDCHEDINLRVRKVGLIPMTPAQTLVATAAAPQLAARNSTCTKYKFSQKEEGTYDKDEEETKQNRRGDSDSDESDEEDEEEWERKEWKRKNKRDKRQATAVGGTVSIIGQRYTFSCSGKGVAADNAGLVPLCSTCWVWRQLPANYQPQYVNELICDDKDGACLSGYATCGSGYRSVEVVRIDGNTRTTVSISAGNYCECKISRSSALLSLVTGNSTSPPALPVVP